MPLKLASSDKRIILIAAVVAAASLWVAMKYFSHAFPEATLTLRVNRGQSEAIAAQFLKMRGFNLAGDHHAAIFDYDDLSKLYLERTLGLARMNQLTRGPIHLWRWEHRWFKPLQKEEFDAEVTPKGEVVGFDHVIPEQAPGANLGQNAARAIAENFLRQVMHRDLSNLAFVEGSSNKRPARTDHEFTWKEEDIDLGAGSYRIEVGVDGDQVASYGEYVKIPDAWTRDYQRIRSQNNSSQLVDQVLWVLLSLALIVILVRRVLDHDVPIRLSLGFAIAAAALYFLGQINEYSLHIFDYPTTQSYSSFIGDYYFRAGLSAVGVGTFIFVLVAGAEPAYREAFPRLASIRRTLTWRGLRSRSFFMANVVGIALAFLFFAYQTVFYLAANHLGAWAPSDIPFSNLLNTRIPWAAVLFGGFFPAISEEMQFRAFSIPFIRKLTRSLPAGVIFSAFIWGFLHSAYPNEPFFIRGVEVGVGGIIIGLVMLRFGIFATMIWHYSVDALYTAFLLLRSPNLYLRVSGGVTAGIMLVPLLVALAAYLGSGVFSEEDPLSNASAGVSRAARKPSTVAAEIPLGYKPLASRRIAIAGILTALCVALLFLPAYRFGKGIELRTSRAETVRAASDFLRARGVEPQNYRHALWLDDNIDPEALRYLLQRKSVEDADRIYRRATRLEIWRARFFKPQQKEEYSVFVDPTNGEVFSFEHVIPEDAPGATLSEVRAQAVAESFLSRHGYALNSFELASSEAVKRKAREDFTFVWQAKSGDPRNVDDAHYRLQVEVAGDQVVRMARYFKLPEQWERQRAESRLGNFVLYGLRTVLGLGLLAGFIILLVKQVRGEKIRWGASVAVGGVLAFLYGAEELVRFSQLYQFYQTSTPLAQFYIQVAASLAIFPLLIGGVGLLVVALATSFYPEAWRVLNRSARRTWRRDAVVAAIVALALQAGLSHLSVLFQDGFHVFAPVSIGVIPEIFGSATPALGIWLSALSTTIIVAAAAGIFIYMARLGGAKRAWWLGIGGLLLLVSLGPSGAHSVREYLAGWVMAFVPLIAAGAVAASFCRNNILAYLAIAFLLQVAGPVVELLGQPAASFRWNGIFLAFLALLTLAWLFPSTPPSGSLGSSLSPLQGEG